MGYDLRRFTRAVDSALLCSLCGLVIENGVESLKCQHIYCYQCLITWLKNNTICPTDNQPLIYTEVRPSTLSLRTILSNLEIRCDFESEGCQQIVTLKLLADHVKHCAFNPTISMKCNLGCGLEMTRKEYSAHNCVRKLASLVTAQQKQIKYFERLVSGTAKGNNDWWMTSGLVFAGSSDTIECHSYCAQLAQHRNPLEVRSHFEAKIIRLGEDSDNIIVGLFDRYSAPTEEHSVINYRSNGSIHSKHDMSAKVVSDDWAEGDTISCGIKFVGQNNIEVYFKRNNELVADNTIICSSEQLYPSVYIWSNGATIQRKLYEKEKRITNRIYRIPKKIIKLEK